MTTFAKNAGKVNTGTVKPDVPWPGRELSFIDEFTATTSDNYVIARVQKCDIVTGGLIMWAAATNAMNIQVGDDADCDRYMLATGAQTNASSGSGACGNFNAITGLGFQHTGPCDIFVSINTGGTGAAALFRTKIIIQRP